jgi:hypothetical protein
MWNIGKAKMVQNLPEVDSSRRVEPDDLVDDQRVRKLKPFAGVLRHREDGDRWASLWLEDVAELVAVRAEDAPVAREPVRESSLHKVGLEPIFE